MSLDELLSKYNKLPKKEKMEIDSDQFEDSEDLNSESKCTLLQCNNKFISAF